VGSTTRRKTKQQDRICFQNVGGLITETDGDIKLQVLLQFTQQHQIDVFGFAEHNTCWDLLQKNEQIIEKTRGWWENSHWSISYNKCEAHPIAHQPGRTGLGVFNAFSHKALKPGGDDEGLGRWSWVCLRGHAGHILCIVLAYRPCYSMGPLSTYQQQIRYLAAKDCTDTPKTRFLTDLKTAIKQWQNEGDTVIVLADMNEDVRSTLIKNTFQEVGMIKGITAQHQ